MDSILTLFAYLSIFVLIVSIVLSIKENENFDFSGELHSAFILSWSLGVMWVIVYLVGI